MALSRERIADELLKLLGLPDPAPTVAVMLDRAILEPVLPEIETAALAGWIASSPPSAQAGIAPDALRRFSALLPPRRALAEKIAARLKLSNKARKRLACAAERDLGTRSAKPSPIASAPKARSTGCCSPASPPKPRRSPAGGRRACRSAAAS